MSDAVRSDDADTTATPDPTAAAEASAARGRERVGEPPAQATEAEPATTRGTEAGPPTRGTEATAEPAPETEPAEEAPSRKIEPAGESAVGETEAAGTARAGEPTGEPPARQVPNPDAPPPRPTEFPPPVPRRPRHRTPLRWASIVAFALALLCVVGIAVTAVQLYQRLQDGPRSYISNPLRVPLQAGEQRRLWSRSEEGGAISCAIEYPGGGQESVESEESDVLRLFVFSDDLTWTSERLFTAPSTGTYVIRCVTNGEATLLPDEFWMSGLIPLLWKIVLGLVVLGVALRVVERRAATRRERSEHT